MTTSTVLTPPGTPALPARQTVTSTRLAARADAATKIYGSHDAIVHALDDVSIGFEAGRFTAMMGPSGSGKSTLLHCLAGLDTLTSGTIRIGEVDLGTLRDRELTRLRRDRIGFVFQSFNLIPTLNALENITLPMALAGRKPDRDWLDRVIDTVGLRTRLTHRPSELSGGQQQRVAVARALASQPEIIFADEPTGNLDSKAGAEILTFLRNAVREMDQTVVMVTHDPTAAAYADRAVFLADGIVVDDIAGPTAASVLDRMKHFGELIAMIARLTIKQLAANKRRLLATSFAIILGVAFLAGTLILTDTIKGTFDDVLTRADAGTDAYIRAAGALDHGYGHSGRPLDATLLSTVQGVDGVDRASIEVSGYAQIVDRQGKAVGTVQTGVVGMNWVTVPALNPFSLSAGRAPSGPNEITIDRHSAELAGLDVGDLTMVLSKGAPRSATIVGITRFAGVDTAGALSVVQFDDATAQDVLGRPGHVDAIAVTAQRGVTPDVLVARLASAVGPTIEVISGSTLTKEHQDDITKDISQFGTFLTMFALIALFVGAFIINNTFSIIVSQRTREMAMLRAIGASGRQVRIAVMAEAALTGLVASSVGVVAGIGVAKGLQALLGALGVDIPLGAMVVSPATVVGSIVVGFVITLVSAVMPARQASRIAPIAALREVAQDRSALSRRRTAIGTAAIALAGATLVMGLHASSVKVVGIGAVALFLAVSVLGPVLARPFAAIIAMPIARLRGTAGMLARQNAMRNPKRTARTASSLMIGVALVCFLTIFAASLKSSGAGAFRHDFHGTAVIDSGAIDSSSGLSPDLAAGIRALPGVRTISEQRSTAAEIDGTPTFLSAYDTRTIATLFHLGHVEGDLARLGSDGIAVEAGHGPDAVRLGDTRTITFPAGTATFTVRATYDHGKSFLGSQFVDLAAFERNMPVRLDSRIYVDVDDLDVVQRAAAGYPTAKVLTVEAFITQQNGKIDTILALMYALLGLAVLIALLGIANTLALSIHERRRELGLLRAVGMSRSQVRSSVRWESVVIALFGATLGLSVGTFLGWALVRAAISDTSARLVIPLGPLAMVTAIAAIAGVGAALMPARRAARIDILTAVATA